MANPETRAFLYPFAEKCDLISWPMAIQLIILQNLQSKQPVSPVERPCLRRIWTVFQGGKRRFTSYQHSFHLKVSVHKSFENRITLGCLYFVLTAGKDPPLLLRYKSCRICTQSFKSLGQYPEYFRRAKLCRMNVVMSTYLMTSHQKNTLMSRRIKAKLLPKDGSLVGS